MDSFLKEKLDEFISLFLEQKEVKQYFALKDEIENSNELNELSKKIVEAKKSLALSFGSNNYEKKKKEYLDLQAEYDSSPLIVNFKMIKEEVEYLLKEFEDKLKLSR